MKIQMILMVAATSLITATSFAQNATVSSHKGNVRTATGITLGHYKLVSVGDSSKLKLAGLTCKLSRQSFNVPNSGRTIYGTSIATEAVNVTECYPGSQAAMMTIIQDLSHPTIYSFAVSILNVVPDSGHFVNRSQESLFIAGGQCTTQDNRLTCNLEDGGNVILDLL